MQAEASFEKFSIIKYAIFNVIALYLTSKIFHSSGNYNVNVTVFSTTVIVYLSLFLYKINVNPSEFIGTATREWNLWRTIFLLILPIFIADFSTTRIIMTAISRYLPEESVKHQYLLPLFNNLVLIPLQTELFRGILLRKFMLKYSVKKTIILSVVIVSALSFSPLTGTLIGCIASLVYLRTTSLMNSILFHVLVNLVIQTVFYMDLKSISESIITYAGLALISCAPVIYYTYRNWPSSNQAA